MTSRTRPDSPIGSWWLAWRLSVGMVSRVPVGDVNHAAERKQTVGRAVLLTPLVGLFLGAILVVFDYSLRELLISDANSEGSRTIATLLIATLTIAALQWLTAGLHSDGLADTADGLAATGELTSRRAVMKRSDLGPVGAMALVFVLGVQVLALALAIEQGRGSVALVTALVAGRVAIIWATRCRPASPEGLGAWVSGSVSRLAVVVASLMYWAITAGLLLLDDDAIVDTDLLLLAAFPAALASALVVNVRAKRRLGGMSGDTIGAAVEGTTTVVLLTFALISSL